MWQLYGQILTVALIQACSQLRPNIVLNTFVQLCLIYSLLMNHACTCAALWLPLQIDKEAERQAILSGAQQASLQTACLGLPPPAAGPALTTAPSLSCRSLPPTLTSPALSSLPCGCPCHAHTCLPRCMHLPGITDSHEAGRLSLIFAAEREEAKRRLLAL
jgi:hypothetical protein